jgi:hypothetical protein
MIRKFSHSGPGRGLGVTWRGPRYTIRYIHHRLTITMLSINVRFFPSLNVPPAYHNIEVYAV